MCLNENSSTYTCVDINDGMHHNIPMHSSTDMHVGVDNSIPALWVGVQDGRLHSIPIYSSANMGGKVVQHHTSRYHDAPEIAAGRAECLVMAVHTGRAAGHIAPAHRGF